MRLYLDTADVKEWDRLLPTGIFYGITTNPLLASRAGLSYHSINWLDMAGRAKALGGKELHIQLADTKEGYLDFSKEMYEIGAKIGIEVVIKIPLTQEGIFAANSIKTLGGKILMTACYHTKQMFTAVTLNADYIAPYFGRMDESGLDAYQHLAQMKTIGRASNTRILVASLRSVDQMITLAAVGQDCFTVAPAIADELLLDLKTDQAALEFEQAAKG